MRKSWGKVEKCIRKTKNLADIGIVEVKIKMQEVVGEENECWSIKKVNVEEHFPDQKRKNEAISKRWVKKFLVGESLSER